MKFVDNSEKVKDKLEKTAIKALFEACMLVHGQAVLLAPVDTGALRGSIDYKVDRQDLIGYVGTNVEYAVYLEFGTGAFAEKGNGRQGGWLYKDAEGVTHFTNGNKPQPYLRPAFRRNRKQIEALMSEILREMGG